MGLKEWIIPQDNVFFDHFDRLAAVLVVASYRLMDLTDNFGELKDYAQQIKQLEHEGDKITHVI